jgi:hypothetical protein
MRRTGRDFYGRSGVLGHSIDAVASLEDLLKRLLTFFPRVHRPLSAYLEAPVGGFPRRALLKCAELFHDVGKPDTARRVDGKMQFHGHEHVGSRLAEVIARRLRLSTDENRSITRLVAGHMRPGNLAHAPTLSDRAIFRFFRDLDHDAVGMLIVSLADHFTYLSERQKRNAADPVLRAVRRMLTRYFQRPEKIDPPKIVDGHVLIRRLKIKEGPMVGRLLGAIREAQAEGRIHDADEALVLARRLINTAEFHVERKSLERKTQIPPLPKGGNK